MIYSYTRVSTDKQVLDNQRFEIARYAEQNAFVVDKHTEEQVSSRVKLDKRKLSKLLKAMKKSDVLVVSEISRLGRSLLEVMGILNFCIQRDIKVIAIRATY